MLNKFEYIIVPPLNSGTLGEIKISAEHFLCENGKAETFAHVKAVADTNKMIAKKYKLDENICEISAYLHDISSPVKPSDMLNYLGENGLYVDTAEKKYPFLAHQRISRIIACEDFDISDENILSAIEYHSTLKANPSPYDMALFVADKLSWDKDGLPPFYDIVRNALETSLENASLAYMKYIIENNMILYPHKWFSEGIEYLEEIIQKV